nr:AI-2E family transporter [Corynebacterium tapiri]
MAKLALADPDNDQIDRSIVIGNWLKHLSMWSLRLIIIAVAGYALWQMMGTLWGGLFPLILALIVCTVLAPMATALRRIGLPAAFAAIVSILSFFGVLGAVVWFIAPDIIGQSRVLYLQLFEGIQRLQLWAQGPPLNLDSSDLTQAVNDAVAWIQQRAGDIAGGVVTGISTATSWIITFFTILVLSVFFLKDGHHFLPFLRGVMGRRAGWHATEVLTRSWETLGGYIRAQAIVSAIDAIVIGIGLYFIGVPMAFTLAVITFLAGFIPLVGAVAAGALAVIVALVSLGVTEALLALAVVIAVQQLEGNILSPLLQSRAMSLHPVIVLVSVVVGGGLFGLAGAFLAVPVAAVIAVVLRYLSEMTALQAGEKRSDEIDFSTPEGRAIGRLSDEQGKRLRAQWREWEPLIDAPEKPAKKPAKRDFIERLLEARR